MINFILMEEKWKSSGLMKELKRVSFMGAPMVVLMVSQYLIRFISVMMVGHIDQLSLAGVSMATSFTSVTGFTVLVIPLLLLFCNIFSQLCDGQYLLYSIKVHFLQVWLHEQSYQIVIQYAFDFYFKFQFATYFQLNCALDNTCYIIQLQFIFYKFEFIEIDIRL